MCRGRRFNSKYKVSTGVVFFEYVILKLFVLLYGDDTIILSENERDLQTDLDSVQEYCTKFKLIVNINKTKIIIFSRGKVRRFTTFKYGCDIIEVV